MIIRQVKSLVGGETLAEPVITKEKEILFQLKERVRINADFNTELRQLAEEHEKITTEH